MFSIFWNGMYFNVIAEDRVKRTFFSKNPAFGFKRCALSEKIEKYFRGEKVEFDCEFELDLPEFTVRVLERVAKIPYGEITTYGILAKELNTSSRAIGQALRKNPVPVLIPCHRIVARSGIGGYSAGVEIKKALLRLEGVQLP
ncbi:MAG: cysteine methyltransferase [Archaeoglobi archaeon]|jgi:methylated-DNA-[protein]-cysteine S-methyltransferase|nr:MAG: cysteine methyltransferase [Archaeoglobi archaeon]